MTTAAEHELSELKSQVTALLQEKADLQAKVDEERNLRYEEERRRDQV